MGEIRRHLTERGEAVLQALLLFLVLDVREVLEEQRGTRGRAVGSRHEREGEPDRLPVFGAALQVDLRPVREERHRERFAQDRRKLRMLHERVFDRCAADGQGPKLEDRPRVLVDRDDAAGGVDDENAAAHPLDEATIEVLAGRARVDFALGVHQRRAGSMRLSVQDRSSCVRE